MSVNAHPAEGEEVGEFVASATDFGMSLTRSRDSTRSHEVSVQRGDRGVVRFMVHETFSSTRIVKGSQAHRLYSMQAIALFLDFS